VNDEHLLAWCRYDPASGSRVLVVVNLAPAEPREGGLQLDLAALDMEGSVHCEATDLLWEPEGGPEIWRVTDLRLRCTPERPVLVFRFRCLPDTAALA
jgi:hypothetical protein